MDWLRRGGRSPSSATSQPDESVPGQLERATPGVPELVEGIDPDGSHSVLDLGPASNHSLQVYTRFARRIRFADVTDLSGFRPRGAPLGTPDLIVAQDEPYDLVFAWDALDRLPPENRAVLIERIAEVTAPGARLFVIADTTGESVTHPLRYSLLDIDRMRIEIVGPEEPAWPPILPAEVERLLMPFQVLRAFTSQIGLREYVAKR